MESRAEECATARKQDVDAGVLQTLQSTSTSSYLAPSEASLHEHVQQHVAACTEKAGSDMHVFTQLPERSISASTSAPSTCNSVQVSSLSSPSHTGSMVTSSCVPSSNVSGAANFWDGIPLVLHSESAASVGSLPFDTLLSESRALRQGVGRPDDEMNRMLLAAYTKLTNTASSARHTKVRSMSACGAGGELFTPLELNAIAVEKEQNQVPGTKSAAAFMTAEVGEVACACDINMPRVSLVRAPQHGATRRTLPESDLDSLDEMEARVGTLASLRDARRTAHPHYRHRPNRRVDTALNELVRVAIVLVLGVLIGKFGGTPSQSSVSEAFERSATSHLEQLKAMHDELVTCLKRSGQLELALHDARSTMVQREYVEKWESLYDEARERNDALEDSYETYKRRYLLAAATQRSLRRALRHARLHLARSELRSADLAERLRAAGVDHLSTNHSPPTQHREPLAKTANNSTDPVAEDSEKSMPKDTDQSTMMEETHGMDRIAETSRDQIQVASADTTERQHTRPRKLLEGNLDLHTIKELNAVPREDGDGKEGRLERERRSKHDGAQNRGSHFANARHAQTWLHKCRHCQLPRPRSVADMNLQWNLT